jgi:hypothetical protein
MSELLSFTATANFKASYFGFYANSDGTTLGTERLGEIILFETALSDATRADTKGDPDPHGDSVEPLRDTLRLPDQHPVTPSHRAYETRQMTADEDSTRRLADATRAALTSAFSLC